MPNILLILGIILYGFLCAKLGFNLGEGYGHARANMERAKREYEKETK